LPSYITKRKGFGKDMVYRKDGENKGKTEDVNRYFQLNGEMKRFVVQYIAHSTRRPLLLAARHKQRLKVCVVCVCVCVCVGVCRAQSADKNIVNTG